MPGSSCSIVQIEARAARVTFEIKFCCVAQAQAKRARRKQAAGAERLALPLDGGDDQSLGRIDRPQQFAGLCLGLRPETLNNPAHSGRRATSRLRFGK